MFPSATAEERGAQTAAVALSDIKGGLPESRTQGYVVALPQVGLTCYLHTLSAAMFFIDAQSGAGTIPVGRPPAFYLSPEAQSRAASSWIRKLLKISVRKSPEEQAMTLLIWVCKEQVKQNLKPFYVIWDMS